MSVNTKFIRYKDTIHNVDTLMKVSFDDSHNMNRVFLTFDSASYDFEVDDRGYFWCALCCFLETLYTDGMCWKSCFVVENVLKEGEDMCKQMKEDIEKIDEIMEKEKLKKK